MKTLDLKMEALQIVLPGEVHPVRNGASLGFEPSRVLTALSRQSVATTEISNGVNIISYRTLGSAHCRQVSVTFIFLALPLT